MQLTIPIHMHIHIASQTPSGKGESLVTLAVQSLPEKSGNSSGLKWLISGCAALMARARNRSNKRIVRVVQSLLEKIRINVSGQYVGLPSVREGWLSYSVGSMSRCKYKEKDWFSSSNGEREQCVFRHSYIVRLTP